MTTIIEFDSQERTLKDISQRFKVILEKRKNRIKEPLTPDKLRERPGLKNLTEAEALEIIQSIKTLAALFFEIACLKKPTCIDNQHVVGLKEEKKAA